MAGEAADHLSCNITRCVISVNPPLPFIEPLAGAKILTLLWRWRVVTGSFTRRSAVRAGFCANSVRKTWMLSFSTEKLARERRLEPICDVFACMKFGWINSGQKCHSARFWHADNNLFCRGPANDSILACQGN